MIWESKALRTYTPMADLWDGWTEQRIGCHTETTYLTTNLALHHCNSVPNKVARSQTYSNSDPFCLHAFHWHARILDRFASQVIR